MARIVDATLGAGVSAQSVGNYCQHRASQVRRLSDPPIPEADVAEIAVKAKQHIGEPYSVIQVIISELLPGTVPIPLQLYCSTLVGLVVAEATGVELSSDRAYQPLRLGTLAARP
jgi:hypothetical protein